MIDFDTVQDRENVERASLYGCGQGEDICCDQC